MEKVTIKEITTDSLKEQDLSKLKKINSFEDVANLAISGSFDNVKIINFKKNGKNFYIININGKQLGYIEGKNKYESLKQIVKQEVEKLGINLEITKVNLLKHQLNVQNNPKTPESKNVDFVIDKLSNYPIDTLIILLSKSFSLDSLKNEFLDNDKLNKYRDSLKGEIVKRLLNASFNEKIKILEKIKSKDSNLFYFFAPYVVFSVQNKEQYAKLKEKFNLKEIIKNTSIDTDFVKLYKRAQTKKLTYHIPAQKADILMKKFAPNVEDVVRKVSYLSITYQSIYGGIGDPNIVFEMLVDNLSKDDVESLDHILTTTGKLQNDFMGDTNDCINKNGLLGCFYETVGATPGARKIANFALAIGLIYGIFKLVKHNGFYGLLTLLGGSWFLFGTKYGKEFLHKLHGLLYGPIDFSISDLTRKNLDRLKKLTDKVKDSEADKLSTLGLASIVFDGMKLEKIKEYAKEENGKIVDFDVSKFKQYLKNNKKYQILQLIEGMGDKAFKSTIIGALNLINKKSNQDKKVNEVVSAKIVNFESENQKEVAEVTNNSVVKNTDEFLEGTKYDNSGKKKPNFVDKSLSSGKKSSIDKKNSSEIKSYFVEKMFFEKGKFHLIGPDGNTKVFSYEDLPLEIKEKLKQKELVLEKINLLNILFQAWCDKYGCKDTTKKEVNEQIQLLIDKLLLGKGDEDFDKKIDEIIEKFAGKGVSAYEMKEIFKLKDKSEIRYRVLSYIKDELDGYKLVVNKIMEDRFDVSGLGDIVMPLVDAVRKNNLSEIENILSKNKLIKDYLTKNGETINDFLDEIQGIIKKVNKLKKDLDIKKLAKKAGVKPEDYEEMINNLIIKNSVKFALFDKFVDAITDSFGKLEKGKDFGQLNKELELYADIKGFGIWNIADENSDIGKIVLETVLLELVALGAGALTAGAGTVAVNSLIATRWANTGKKIYDLAKMSKFEKALNVVKIGNTSYKVGKFAKFSYLTGTTALEGALFYEVANMVHNFIEGNELFEGWNDGSEIFKSILMIGVLKGMGEVFKLTKLNIKDTDKFSTKVLKFTGQVTIEGTALGLTDLGVDIVFDEGDWTVESIAQGIMMALVYKLMGYATNKVFIRKKGDKVSLEVSESYITKEKVEGTSYYNIYNNKGEKIKVVQDARDIQKLKNPNVFIEGNVVKIANKKDKGNEFIKKLKEKPEKGITEMRKEIKTKEENIVKIKEEIKNVENQIKEMENSITEKKLLLFQKESILEGKRGKIYELESTNKPYILRINKYYKKLKQEVKDLETEIKKIKSSIEEMTKNKEELIKNKNEMEKRLKDSESAVENMKKELTQMEENIKKIKEIKKKNTDGSENKPTENNAKKKENKEKEQNKKLDEKKLKQASEGLKGIHEDLINKFGDKKITVKGKGGKILNFTFGEISEFTENGWIALKDIAIDNPKRRLKNMGEVLKNEKKLLNESLWNLGGTPTRVPFGIIRQVIGLGKDEVSTVLRFALTGRMKGPILKPIAIGTGGIYLTYFIDLLSKNDFDVKKSWEEFTINYPLENPTNAILAYIAFSYFTRLALLYSAGKLGYKKLTDGTIILNQENDDN